MVKYIWEMASKNLNYLRSALSLGTFFEAFFFSQVNFSPGLSGEGEGGWESTVVFKATGCIWQEKRVCFAVYHEAGSRNSPHRFLHLT